MCINFKLLQFGVNCKPKFFREFLNMYEFKEYSCLLLYHKYLTGTSNNNRQVL